MPPLSTSSPTGSEPAASAARPIRLAAFAAGPVFYQVPLYRLLAADPRVDLTVIYGSSGGVRPYDAGLGGRAVAWDVDLLSGYRSVFLERADRNDVLGGFLALRDPDVVSVLRRGEFDALWIHGFQYLTSWLALAGAGRRPVLLREEQTLLHERPAPRRWLREAVLRALFARVHALAIGSANRAYYRRYGLPEERLFHVPYCVDNDALQARAVELAPRKAELRRRFGIADDAGPVVLFVGKLEAKKQPLRLLEAFARARAGGRRCTLLLVGEGPLGPELRRRAGEDVRLAGFLNRSEIPQAFAAADLFVLPSARHETWGLVVNEAMNFSLPVVVSDKVGCAPDLVHEGRNGHVVAWDDTEALAERIAGLVVDAGRRRAYGARSLELVAACHYRVAAEGVVAAAQAALAR